MSTPRRLLSLFTALLILPVAPATAQVNQDEAMVLIPSKIAEKPAPLFFSAETTTVVNVLPNKTDHIITAKLRVVQGRPEVLSLGLNGEGEITAVTGDGLQSWTIRQESDGRRFIDIKPVLPLSGVGGITLDSAATPAIDLTTPREFTFTITASHEISAEKANQPFELLHPSAGAAVGFSSTIEVRNDGEALARVIEATGLQPLQGMPDRFFTGSGKLRVTVGLKSSAARPVEFTNVSLEGTPSADLTGISFILRGELQVSRAGEATTLLENAALSGASSGEGWYTRLKKEGEVFVHEIVGEKEGKFPIELAFEAPLIRRGDWRGVDFKLHGGAVVPVKILGLPAGVSFDPSMPVVPERRNDVWTGFLPAAGSAAFAWKSGRQEGDGALFFTSNEVSDTRVGAGLARRYSKLSFRVLQGKLEGIKVRVDGPGEILAVQGAQVLAWSVAEEGGARMLDVRLSRPIEVEGEINIEAQAAIGAFPVTLQPLRFTPQGALSHRGFVRVANDGAVRLEIAAAKGLMQLSPAQFPWAKPDEAFRQAFVYRFPSPDYGYEIRASQVLPEVSVTEVTIHELAETDRRILADIELDIREAPLREWTLQIPSDFVVAGLTGAAVADYSLASEAKDGRFDLKILFNQALIGRQLISLRLEKGLAAQAGEWVLPVLTYPGAKSSRGYLGVVATAGFRVVPATTTGLAETPPDYFPKKQPGLQQAFRIREGAWSATMRVEALGQSIQADVFHLYSLKEGVVSGSVAINYFVVGAPATQWRLRIPKILGNVEITGQNVGQDQRDEGDTKVIPLTKPLLGSGTLLITFEQPMSARGGDISLADIRPLDVQSERGFVQVVSPLQVNATVTRSEGAVLKLDPSELPAEYRVLSSSPTIAAWQYTAGDVVLAMNVTWYPQGETESLLVDHAKLSSRVSRDGQAVTDARFYVKSRGRSALRVTLPENSKLWEASVDGVTVNAREDGNETVVPLPAKADPNDPVDVVIRYGMASNSATRPVLAAPTLGAPLVFGEWKVSGDENRRLVPRGSGIKPVLPVLTESGSEWIFAKARTPAALVLLAAALGLFLQRFAKLQPLAVLVFVVAVVGSFGLAMRAFHERRVNLGTLEFAMPAVPTSEPLSIELRNVAPWVALINGWGIFFILAGIALLVFAFMRSRHAAYSVPGGLALIAFGVLAQRMGAVPFFVGFGVVLLLVKVLPGLATFVRRKPPVVAATALIAFACMLGDLRAQAPVPAPIESATAAESMTHNWRIVSGRLSGEITVEARGKADERFLLLKPPAVLTAFTGDGWRVVKAPYGEQEAYYLISTIEGKKTGKATFEMPLPNPQGGWALPSGPAAVQRVAVHWNQEGWDFESPQAAKVVPLDAKGESGAELVLRPAENTVLRARPKQRDAASEQTQFYVEISDLYLPGPGVVNGRHLIAVRPSRGVVRELVAVIPEGFTVGEVAGGPAGSWRFNPETRELKIAIEPAQDQPFTVSVATQRGTAALPVDLALSPLQVKGAAGSVGLVGLAFGDEAQAESVVAKGMNDVNLDDFNATLLPRDREGKPLAVVHRSFRHAGGEASLTLKVTPVAPEIRATTTQTLSLGEDRMVLGVELAASITRAGVFKLALEIPAGFEIESVTGPSLADWTDSQEDKARVLNLHLNGRTIGEQAFAIALVAPSPGAQANWSVPRVLLREASRQTGTLTIVPDRGFQVRAVNRDKVSVLDTRESGASRPNALAFRLLQSDWALSLAIAKLDPWVTAQVLHEVTLREGQTLSRARLIYKIENAAMKSLRVRIPGLDASAAATVRASGPAVGDFVPVAGEENLWEIRFQRGITGAATVDIEFQRQTSGESVEIAPLELAEVRQLSYFVAIRTGGRLEIVNRNTPRGWTRREWSEVTEALREASSAPVEVYRVAEPEGPLALTLKRHEIAEALKLRVQQGSLTTLVSPKGTALTAVDLAVQVAEKGTLSLTLPDDAKLFSVMVNEGGVPLVRDGDKWKFHVYPAPEGDRPASVRFVYSTPPGRLTLIGPRLDVPLEDLSWRVILPKGWHLKDSEGDFDLKDQKAAPGIEDYGKFIARKRAAGKKDAVALLEQANEWLRQGEQDKAGEALSKAASNGLLDQASNEDARVQLGNLKAQQATLALNTRRQRMYLDNRSEVAAGNKQLERAALENPLLQGNVNYDPKQFDRLLEGNSLDENTAMKAMGNRLAERLAADPAPAALDVTLGASGTILDFKRSVQVNGLDAMVLKLDIEPDQTSGWFYALIVCVLVGFILAPRFVMKRSTK
ncbi:hypothetical protein [Haloferula sp. BvORR071]|uniref:hypothetical protein n=1 Tax=Haloferula sp. BvORR071 TaxID=1396141 RepID=UPI00054FD24E|nr:hypothetical protein [Haloferula sp. BvORR071]